MLYPIVLCKYSADFMYVCHFEFSFILPYFKLDMFLWWKKMKVKECFRVEEVQEDILVPLM